MLETGHGRTFSQNLRFAHGDTERALERRNGDHRQLRGGTDGSVLIIHIATGELAAESTAVSVLERTVIDGNAHVAVSAAASVSNAPEHGSLSTSQSILG